MSRASTLVEVGLDELCERLESARHDIRIASPFISRDVADLVADSAADGGAGNRRLLTSLSHGALASGFLSVDGLRLLAGRDFALRSLLNLHAKVVLIDGNWGLVGSGNLTAAGQDGGNAELGVLLTRAQARDAEQIFERWWASAYDVGPRDLASAARTAKRLGPPRSPVRGGYGGRHRLPPGKALRRQAARNGDLRGRGLWLKPLHNRPERDAAGWWHTVDEITDPHTIRGGRMIGRPGYRDGDLLLFYISGTLKCPAIVQVTGTPRDDLDKALRAADEEDRRRGWFTTVEPVVGCDIAVAPDIDTIGIPRGLVQRRPRLTLSTVVFDRARRELEKVAAA